MDIISMAYAKKLVNGLQSGLDNASIDNDTCSITFHWKNGTSSTMTFPKPLDGANGVGISNVKLKEVTVGSGKETHLICTLEDGTEIDAGNIPNYDDTQIKKDINDVDDKIETLKSTQSLEYKGESVICNNTLASRTSDMFIKGKTYVNLGTGGLESAGEKENKISILSNNNKSADDANFKEYKKEILLTIDGGLKSLSKGVYDTIEQKADGVYLVQRVKKIPLYNPVNFMYPQEQNSANTVLIYLTNTHDAKPNSSNILCNVIKSSDAVYDIWSSSFDKEGIVLNYKADLLMRINKSRLNTVDYNGIKKFVTDSQLTVYYPLKTPIETKLNINNLDLEVYEGTTCITTDNALQPILSFKVPSNIGGIIQENSQNINKLYKLIDEVIIPQIINNSADIELLKLK